MRIGVTVARRHNDPMTSVRKSARWRLALSPRRNAMPELYIAVVAALASASWLNFPPQLGVEVMNVEKGTNLGDCVAGEIKQIHRL